MKVLASKDAKKAYVSCTAAALRARESVMQTVTAVQENAEDILAEAKQINEDRAAREEDICGVTAQTVKKSRLQKVHDEIYHKT